MQTEIYVGILIVSERLTSQVTVRRLKHDVRRKIESSAAWEAKNRNILLDGIRQNITGLEPWKKIGAEPQARDFSSYKTLRSKAKSKTPRYGSNEGFLKGAWR